MLRHHRSKWVHRYAIGNDSTLTERDRADVQKVVDAWVTDSVLYAEEQRWIELEGAHSACLMEEGRRLIAREAH